MYDYLVVGAGLFGAVFAHEATMHQRTCLVIDKRNAVGGNCRTYDQDGIIVHKYGAHIFHTSNEKVQSYITRFAKFNRFVNTPIASYGGKLYSLPFNMHTFYELWGTKTPAEAKEKIRLQTEKYHIENPLNLEEAVLSTVGEDIYEILIKGYTTKQWGKSPKDLPASIIRRIPLRFTFNGDYFNDSFEGIPIGGYTPIVEKLLEHCDIKLNTDFFNFQTELMKSAKKIIFTGQIDAYFQYRFGPLEYRSLLFKTKKIAVDNFQGNAVVNYTDEEIPYTRIIEHKHFEFGIQPFTIITYEYPLSWDKGKEPFYPINDKKNTVLYESYKKLASVNPSLIFAGRLGSYRYYDMQDTIAAALDLAAKEFT
ncbi:UDP-galactopyranose mutase [Treponema sp. Marseille-Q4523]|uniref:UDP-galactopyranose mutase n=1 Tax=Treponema sp. Marseille-Q4523 TaxID=2810610 RepID=UPI001960E042|nr:UDP-galactopyranose mutase [Treponema sp. Marseille-Q4523]MBM7023602.1 UDP-galactopyranose mutase [Treponema sp. Marseille-Q4523]